MYILLSIIAFGILIAIHEAGHFCAAKACGVRVNEFSIGMGPTLLKKQGNETLYSLRLFPFGGFCAMEGEDEETGDPRAFSAKPAWQRAIILCSGAAMNFLLGFLLALCIAPFANFNEPVIHSFFDNCPYEGEAAFLPGDRIHSVDGHRLYFVEDLSYYLGRGQKDEHGDSVHRIVVIRDGRRVVLDDFPIGLREYPDANGGTVTKYGFYFMPRETGFFANVRYAWLESLNFVRLVWRALGDLFTGAVGLRDLSGPVGVISYVHEVEAATTTPLEAYFSFFYIFSLIAVNLAVTNMLPLPALDGGRAFFLLVTFLIEKITRKRLNPKYEGYIHTAGFVLLMGLMLFVLLSDIFKLIAKR